MRRADAAARQNGGSVAYVLKSFPRLSETFIASEIYRLQQRGVRLRLFVIKRSNERLQHPVVDAITAPCVHLPETTSISTSPLRAWMARHFASFRPALARRIRRHPFRALRAAAMAAAFAFRGDHGWQMRPRKSAIKEFLQAAVLADAMAEAGDVRHVHAHFCHSSTTVAWLAATMLGLPLSFTAHAKDVYQRDLNPAGMLERKLAAARFVVTCTDANRSYLQERTSTPVHCLYHGLNVEFAQLCAGMCRREPNDRVRVLAVGRLVRKKGFDVLLDACALLRDRGVPVEALIVGESGDHERFLQDRIAQLDLREDVTLAGPMSQAQLVQEYARATVFCLPCRVLDNGDRDGIPNVVAEAMACGVPVVTTEISGIPELIADDVNGLLVPQDDAHAVAAAIERLYREPGLAERLSDDARASIRERFDGDKTATELSVLLQEAIAC